MQTFITDLDFSRTILDYRRLGKQRVETLQILQSIKDNTCWRNHPVTKLWNHHYECLVNYGTTICDLWLKLGFKDTCKDKILSFKGLFNDCTELPAFITPEVIVQYREHLLSKNLEYYKKHWPDLRPKQIKKYTYNHWLIKYQKGK